MQGSVCCVCVFKDLFKVHGVHILVWWSHEACICTALLANTLTEVMKNTFNIVSYGDNCHGETGFYHHTLYFSCTLVE